MSSLFLWGFVLQIMCVMFLVWGAFHEDRLISFERRIADKIRKAVRK